MKRQRVGIACDKCRLLKAKCDGRRPICSRCEGYDFSCTWSARGSRSRSSQSHPADAGDSGQRTKTHYSPAEIEDSLSKYSRAVESYELLIRDFRSRLSSVQNAVLDDRLRGIRCSLQSGAREEQLTSITSNGNGCNNNNNANGSSSSRASGAVLHDDAAASSSPTYVGKASDIHFIHSIRQRVYEHEPHLGNAEETQNYNHSHTSDTFATLKHPLLIPTQGEADQYLDVYLSTIHVAYPFLCNSILLEAFQRFQSGDHDGLEFQPWLSLFNFIFAIGSYYMSFPHGKHTGSRNHFRYFEQGIYFSYELSADCSLINIWILLVQCFFLLAVCLTDRCWNTLGLAIRMGQSLGLHVESSPSCNSDVSWAAHPAHRRRSWYSMYVLDRLLALQLGRPMAIHEGDFQVELPSLDDLSAFTRSGPEVAAQESSTLGHGSMMDYFVQVIRFSHVVGLAIRGLYRPSQIDLSPDQMLNSASSLDQRLLEWKMNLPRHLRFDLGHTFEKSISFKRQRNMLAVKFHHLRALIHRPFLCLPILQMNNHSFMNLLLQDKERIFEAEGNCIYEAQETAHLLHNVADERSLVHDFPWWQMISCLICASSILFVAETFCSNRDRCNERTSAQNLREDAETCLKVFEALSVNSAAARKAADMLAGLSRMRRSTEEVNSGNAVQNPSLPSQNIPVPVQHSSELASAFSSPAYLSSHLPDDMSFLSDWPSEISGSMEWSAQFLDYPHFEASDLPLTTSTLQ